MVANGDGSGPSTIGRALPRTRTTGTKRSLQRASTVKDAAGADGANRVRTALSSTGEGNSTVHEPVSEAFGQTVAGFPSNGDPASQGATVAPTVA